MTCSRWSIARGTFRPRPERRRKARIWTGSSRLLEQECRRLHAEFVIGREGLLRICTRARREIAREIVVGRPAAARATVARKAPAETRSARGPAGADVPPAAERGERHG